MARPGEFVPEYIVTANDMNALPGGVLGYAEVTTGQSGIGSEANLTGLSVTVDVPAGRRVRISSLARFDKSGAGGRSQVRIKESTTTLGATAMGHHATGAAGQQTHTAAAVVIPSSGSHTYHLAAEALDGGTTSLLAGANNPAFILVEDIGAA